MSLFLCLVLLVLHSQVSVCPYDVITGYTLFVEDEEKTLDSVVTRADLEGHIVVNLAGHCAEKLVMGQSEVTGEWVFVGTARREVRQGICDQRRRSHGPFSV